MAGSVLEKLYPEIGAGGYARNSARALYFLRVRALIEPSYTVLDFGAGRGVANEVQPDNFLVRLGNFRGDCAKLIGVDVDPVVLTNPMLDDAVLMNSDGTIPLADHSVDLIYSWCVFEHVSNPGITTRELTRILKPGGWICAWTPNKYSYLALIASLIPNRLHSKVLSGWGIIGGKGQREHEDVFPTVYKLNTQHAIRRYFPKDCFNHYSFKEAGAPVYGRRSLVAARLMQLWARVMPEAFQLGFHVFLRKKPGARFDQGQGSGYV